MEEEKERLEKKVVVALVLSFASLILAIPFLSSSLTGHVVAGLTQGTSSMIGVGLFIIGITSSYFWFKKK